MKLSVKNLNFGYADEPILKNVTFEVTVGKCAAVLGPNGAGKSTLLKCIDGIVTSKSGSVVFGERDLLKMNRSERSLSVAYVAQQPLFADGTVFDSVLIGRLPHMRWGAGDTDLKKVSQTIEKLGLSNLALRSVNELSGGERQKIAVARALVQEAPIMLFDEPTSNLDLKNQIDALNLIKSVVDKSEKTVLITMHDINLALRFADEFVFMKDGAIHTVCDRSGVNPSVIETVFGLSVVIAEIDGNYVVVPR